MKKIISILLFLVILVSGCSTVMTEEQKDKKIMEKLVSGEVSEAKKMVVEYYGDKKDEDKAIAWFMVINDEVEKNNVNLKSSILEDYMKNNNIYLSATDVQYNMKNNVDKKFAITGTIELDDYYNYGFDDSIEKDYFCASLEQPGGSYSTNWYLYFHRQSFLELFNTLKERPAEITATLIIPKYRYEEGQGNMAQVESVTWR